MSFFPMGFDRAIESMLQTQFSVLSYGFLAAMLSMVVGVEIRIEQAQRPSHKPWFFQRLPIVFCYLMSMWFTSVFSSLALPLSKIGNFSVTASFVTFVMWMSIILFEDWLAWKFRAKASVFSFLFAFFVAFSFFGAHACFMFLPNSLEVGAIYWPGLLLAFGFTVGFLGILGRFAWKSSMGKDHNVRDRLIYIFSLVFLNQFVVFALIGFVPLKGWNQDFAWYWMPLDWGRFEIFVSLLTLGMITLLIYKVHQALDSAMRTLRTDQENLRKMNQLALQEVASASDSLRVKQDKITQLEKVIVSAKTEHLLSVEGLLAALATLEDGMFEWNLEDDIIEMSSLWVKRFELSSHYGSHQPVQEWKNGFVEEDRHFIEEGLQTLLTGQAPHAAFRVRYRTMSGRLLRLELRMVAVKNPYGLSGKLVGIFHDHTEDMDVEMSIRQELSEESILSTRKTQFVSYLAHEIRTPMTVIASARALLEVSLNQTGQILPERIWTYIDQIGSALSALRTLVDETLMFMGTTYSRSQIQIEAIDILAMLSRFSEVEQKRRHGGRLIRINCTSDPKHMVFYSCEPVIFQAIRHLANYVQNHLEDDPVIEVSGSDDILNFSFTMSKWPEWMVKVGEQEPNDDCIVNVPFSDEFLPFSLLIVKRVVRLIRGGLVIKSQERHYQLIIEIPSLKEDSCLEY